MKREKNSESTMKNSLLFLLPLILLLMFDVSSCGKSGTPESPALQPAAASSDEATNKQDKPLVEVDEMPVFPGGNAALLKFIAENSVYPEEAKKNNITGRVIVRFVVEKDCSVSNVEVLKEVDPLLDAEAVRVINSLPKFEKPARNGGVAVPVFYMVPITFALK